MKLISKEVLVKLVDKLDNAIDKFLIVGLFYGLAGDSKEGVQLLSVKKSDVNFSTNTLLVGDKEVEMDDYLKKIVESAVNQTTYVKMGSQGRTNEDYTLNSNSEYIIRSKPTRANGMGMNHLTRGGYNTRIKNISAFLGVDLTPSMLKQSGVFHLLKEIKKDWTIREAEDFLKERQLGIRRNTLAKMLKEIR